MALTEREALNLWKEFLVAAVRSDTPDLTQRQQALLAIVGLTAGPHTVRGLAEQLDITKPAVTRGVDTLEKYGLVRRVKDMQDLRNVFIERTPAGTLALRETAELIRASASGDTAAVPASRGAQAVA